MNTIAVQSMLDQVGSKPTQSIAVIPPRRIRAGGDTPIIVELYAYGRGVSVAGQESNLLFGQGTFELKAYRKTFVIDPVSAYKAYGHVTSVQGDIRTILLPIDAINQEHLTKFGHGGAHSQLPKAAILSLPIGEGKSLISEALAQRLGLRVIVDEWTERCALIPYGLHLTSCESQILTGEAQ